MPTPSRELLIASPARWDEACFSVPAVRALAGSGLGIGILCQPQQEAFWQTLPGLEVRTPTTLADDWQVALLWEEGALAKAVRKAGILKRIGPAVGKLPRQLTETLVDRPHPTDHRVQFYLKAVQEMGVETARPEYFSPAQPPPPAPHARLLISPDSDFGESHQWPLEQWLQLVEALLGTFPQLALACTYDAGVLEVALDEFGERITFEPFHLRQPDLSLLARQPLVLAADGSLPHLAAHMGATCLTLFGPNDPRWKRPLGRRHRLLQRHVACAPCLMPKCPLDLRCQRELEVDAVLDVLRAVTA